MQNFREKQIADLNEKINAMLLKIVEVAEAKDCNVVIGLYLNDNAENAYHSSITTSKQLDQTDLSSAIFDWASQMKDIEIEDDDSNNLML